MADSNPDWEPPHPRESFTYAAASILRTSPPLYTAPRERSRVYLANQSDAEMAYGVPDMARKMAFGRLRNGGSRYAGLAWLDLAYLLGDQGGHVNVTGMAGVGTKSSFLLTLVKLLLHEALSSPTKEPLHIVPIIVNVKGEDLMWIDRPNRVFSKPPDELMADWQALGLEPTPFISARDDKQADARQCTFYSPTDPRTDGAPSIDGCNAESYGWSLSDVIAEGLFPFLFAADDLTSPQRALIYHLVDRLTAYDGMSLRPDGPAQNVVRTVEVDRGSSR